MMQVCTTKSVSMEIPIAAKTNTLRVAKRPLSLDTFLESSSVENILGYILENTEIKKAEHFVKSE